MSPGAAWPGAEGSRCAVPQHRVGQRLIGHHPLPPTVLALPFFQPLGRVDPQPPVLPPPAVIRWLGHAEAARDLRDRFPRREHPLRLPQVADDRLGRVPLACHAHSLRTGPNPRTGSGPVLGGQVKRKPRTTLGYPRLRCRACGRRFNEPDRHALQRSPVPDGPRAPRRAVAPAVHAQLPRRGRAAPRAGLRVTHETIRIWEFRLAPLLADRLRAKRRGCAGVSWSIDETDVKVAGRWCSLYRAIDRDGALLDSMLSEHRDKHAARRFLRRLVDVAQRKPQRVTTDPHPPYRRAIRWILGRTVRHRCNRYLNTLTEQSHLSCQTTLRPHAGLREFRVRRSVLYRIRCAAPVLSRSPTRSRMGAAG